MSDSKKCPECNSKLEWVLGTDRFQCEAGHHLQGDELASVPPVPTEWRTTRRTTSENVEVLELA